MAKNPKHLIQKPTGMWVYRRKIPADVAHLDVRNKGKTWRIISTGEKDMELAIVRRLQLEKADDEYWSALRAGVSATTARERYDAAVAINKVVGLSYPTEDLDLNERMKRHNVALQHQPEPEGTFSMKVDTAVRDLATGHEEIVELDQQVPDIDTTVYAAVMGKHKPPSMNVRETFEWWCRRDKKAKQQIKGKSPDQLRRWRNIRLHALATFEEVFGKDISFIDITRQDGKRLYEYLDDKVEAGELKGDSARKDLGFIRTLWGCLADYEDIDRNNPLRNLGWDKDYTPRPPFKEEWLKLHFLQGERILRIDEEQRLPLLALIETGARPTEIVNLRPEDIKIDHNIPHICIADRDDREQKNKQSVRNIPLVGVALDVFRKSPNGFPRYQDKGSSFSQTLNQALRRCEMMESDRHTLYSLRHCFEDRLKRGEIGDDMRRALFGHKEGDTRPKYGDGYTLSNKLAALEKIALPFDRSIV